MDLLLETHDSGHPGDIVIGAEIREYDEETDVSGAFFEADTTYIQDVGPYKAPEQYTEFDCRAVLKCPGTDELLAVGFGRGCDQTGEPWNVCAYPQDIWERGWIVKPDRVGDQ
jgi:hypothetical protein